MSGIGELLRQARVAKGFTLDALALELHWRVDLLQAVEQEAWDHIPPGQERPMVRQMAAHLELDLAQHPEALDQVPGEVEAEAPDPRQLKLERAVSVVLAAGSLLVLAWLLIPARDLTAGARPASRRIDARTGPLPSPPPSAQAYPVIGEAIPEAPVTEEGVLITLRAIDQAKATLQSDTQRLEQVLRASEPWRVRMPGPFTLALENAGVVVVEVAGRSVRHGRHVGDTWTATFDAQGRWLLPVPTLPPGPVTGPEPPLDDTERTER